MEWFFSFFFLHNHSKVLLLSEDRIRDLEEWTLWCRIEENGKVNDDETEKEGKKGFVYRRINFCWDRLYRQGNEFS